MSDSGVRCLLLDLGGVLLNFDFQVFAERMLQLTGADRRQLESVLAGDGLDREFSLGRVSPVEFHAEFCRRLGTRISPEQFAAAWNSIFHPDSILPGDLIAALASRFSLWIVSNTNRMHFDFVLGRYPFLRHFDGWILSCEVGAAKPDAAIFHHALRAAGSFPSETLFVDDVLENVAAAKRLGIDSVQFESVEQLRQELEARRMLREAPIRGAR